MKRYQTWLKMAAWGAVLAALSACGDDHWYGPLPPPVPPSSDGAGPDAMIQGGDGNFYGTTAGGGAFAGGAVFKVTAAGVETLLYSFAGGGNNGATPQSLIQGSDGNFYGATAQGGVGPCSQGCGTIFKITPTGLLTTLYSFTGAADGGVPNAVIQGSDGNFYGATEFGGLSNSTCGSRGCGVVFKVTPTGVESVLYAFAGGSADGALAQSLIQGTDGNFYGLTNLGGASNNGVVFKVTPAGVETVLHAFAGGSDGAQPVVALLQASNGNFYGTTPYGGASNQGTVFSITPAGVETVLHAFAGGTTDGAIPYTGVIQGTDGNFYGTTSGGGDTSCVGGCGTVYRLTSAGVESQLYGFTAGAFGGGSQAPSPSSLLQATNGSFYGTTFDAGEFGNGTAFQLTSTGVVSLLYSFGTNNP
jgi:uncharacterized repeat protein (TIGR03803 family)